jgi:hypothetical protein
MKIPSVDLVVESRPKMEARARERQINRINRMGRRFGNNHKTVRLYF